jgi:hypothetical protein
MKKMIKICSIVLSLLLLTQVNLFAQNDNDNDNDDKGNKKKYEFEKTKTVNKTYNVSVSDKLSIDNRFGSVEIHTWNKNEVKVDVEIKVTAKTEDWAKSVLNDIEVEDSKSGNLVKFKTLFSEDLDRKEGGSKHQDKYKGKDSRQTMEVNYQVYMPSSNPLDIENEFGPLIIPDYTGEVDLTSKFGKLETGNLSNVKNISVEFGKAKLGNIRGGNLSIKFSSATFSKLSGNIKLNIEFSNKIILNLDNNLSTLDMKASYSTINLKPAGDLSAAYNVSTSFGNFRNRTGIRFDTEADDPDNHGPKFDREFTGKTGSGNISVKIKSSFTTIVVGETTEEDFKDKEKDKNKQKSKTKTS